MGTVIGTDNSSKTGMGFFKCACCNAIGPVVMNGKPNTYHIFTFTFSLNNIIHLILTWDNEYMEMQMQFLVTDAVCMQVLCCLVETIKEMVLWIFVSTFLVELCIIKTNAHAELFIQKHPTPASGRCIAKQCRISSGFIPVGSKYSGEVIS